MPDTIDVEHGDCIIVDGVLAIVSMTERFHRQAAHRVHFRYPGGGGGWCVAGRCRKASDEERVAMTMMREG